MDITKLKKQFQKADADLTAARAALDEAMESHIVAAQKRAVALDRLDHAEALEEAMERRATK